MSVNFSHLSVDRSTPDFNKHEHELNQLLHDIKSPLSSLNLCISHLEKNCENSKNKEVIDIIKLALGRLCVLVSNETSSGHFLLASELSKIVTELSYCSDISIELKGLSYSVNDISFKGNGDLLKTIITNIVNNSKNARATKVVCEVIDTEELVQIRIRDNGTGIEKKLIPFVGKPGFSFQNTKKGHGLGLSHAAETLKSWGGSLAISSEVNLGTEVILNLAKR